MHKKGQYQNRLPAFDVFESGSQFILGAIFLIWFAGSLPLHFYIGKTAYGGNMFCVKNIAEKPGVVNVKHKKAKNCKLL